MKVAILDNQQHPCRYSGNNNNKAANMTSKKMSCALSLHPFWETKKALGREVIPSTRCAAKEDRLAFVRIAVKSCL